MSAAAALGVLNAASSSGGGSLSARMGAEGIDRVAPGASTGQSASDYEKGRAVGAKVVSMKTRSRAKQEG